MCCCNGLKCAIMVEVPTSAVNVSFPDVQRLRNSHIVGIEVNVPNEEITTPSGRDVPSIQVHEGAYISIVNTNGTEIVKTTLMSFMRYWYQDAYGPRKVNWTNFDPTQSSLSFLSLGFTPNASEAIVITFWIECDNCGVPE